MNFLKIVIVATAALFCLPAFSLDANEDGDWISMGIPKRFHMGSNGLFYMDGTNHGKCAGTTPSYFRMNMDKPHFKEFYSWVLYMAAQNNSMDCRVQTSCGGNEVWVEYCRGPL